MNAKPDRQTPEDRQLTWTILLAKWTQFAKASWKLPKTEEADRWRAAVAPIISLQAVTHAMADLDDLDMAERRVAFDKAEVLVKTHGEELERLWEGGDLPEMVIETIEDAAVAIECARNGGLEWILLQESLVTGHPAELIAMLRGTGFEGDLYVPSPGIPLFSESPVAFMRGPLGAPVDEDQAMLVQQFLGGHVELQWRPRFRQVYRQFNFLRGGAAKDLVQNSSYDPLPGQALLVQAIADGRELAVAMPPKKGKIEIIPVEYEDPDLEDVDEDDEE